MYLKKQNSLDATFTPSCVSSLIFPTKLLERAVYTSLPAHGFPAARLPTPLPHETAFLESPVTFCCQIWWASLDFYLPWPLSSISPWDTLLFWYLRHHSSDFLHALQPSILTLLPDASLPISSLSGEHFEGFVPALPTLSELLFLLYIHAQPRL